jgi:hypothetical protein
MEENMLTTYRISEAALVYLALEVWRRVGLLDSKLRPENEERYIDMRPVIFVFVAVAMAVRYISLGPDDQDLYILAGISFALMYALRPYFFKLQRPKD